MQFEGTVQCIQHQISFNPNRFLFFVKLKT